MTDLACTANVLRNKSIGVCIMHQGGNNKLKGWWIHYAPTNNLSLLISILLVMIAFLCLQSADHLDSIAVSFFVIHDSLRCSFMAIKIFCYFRSFIECRSNLDKHDRCGHRV